MMKVFFVRRVLRYDPRRRAVRGAKIAAWAG